jgi:hypothetical protein
MACLRPFLMQSRCDEERGLVRRGLRGPSHHSSRNAPYIRDDRVKGEPSSRNTRGSGRKPRHAQGEPANGRLPVRPPVGADDPAMSRLVQRKGGILIRVGPWDEVSRRLESPSMMVHVGPRSAERTSVSDNVLRSRERRRGENRQAERTSEGQASGSEKTHRSQTSRLRDTQINSVSRGPELVRTAKPAASTILACHTRRGLRAALFRLGPESA